MTVRSTPVPRQFSPTHKSKFKNILVNGCSYTWNESQTSPVTWPYYLRDLCDFEQIFDCSQGGSGSNHIFSSTINELETNSSINCHDTLVVIMWSALTRVDLIVNKDIDFTVSKKHDSINLWLNQRYHFSKDLISMPLRRYKIYDNESMLDKLQEMYHKLIDSDAQIVASATKILALDAYLKNKGFTAVFLTWEKNIWNQEISQLPTKLSQTLNTKIHTIKTLGEYTDENNLRIPNDGHPSPDAHLGWTKTQLIPALELLEYVCQKT